MKLPDSEFKKEADPYKRCMWILTGTSLVGVLALTSLFMCSEAKAQVSVFTDPESDTIVFEDYSGTTYEVTPSMPGQSVSIPSGFGYDSTFSVSPGGYATRTYEVDQDE